MGNIIAWFIGLIINNPMIVIGFGLAAYYKFTYPPQIVQLIFTHAWVPYAIIISLGLAYALIFKHIYFLNSKKINWTATILSSFVHMFTMALAMAIAFGILYAWDYAFVDQLDDYLRYKK